MHYILILDWATDMCEGVDILSVNHSLEDAKSDFQKVFEKEKRNNSIDSDWTIYENTDVKFDAGDDGNYLTEHFCLYILAMPAGTL